MRFFVAPSTMFEASRALSINATQACSARARLASFVSMQLSTYQQNYYFQEDGVIRDEVRKAQRRTAASLFSQAWTQKVWSDSRPGFSDEFGEFVDGLIRDGEAAGREMAATPMSSFPEIGLLAKDLLH
jgi:hypothetical protein